MHFDSHSSVSGVRIAASGRIPTAAMDDILAIGTKVVYLSSSKGDLDDTILEYDTNAGLYRLQSKRGVTRDRLRVREAEIEPLAGLDGSPSMRLRTDSVVPASPPVSFKKTMKLMETEKKVMMAFRGSRPHDCGLSMSSSSCSCSRVLHKGYCAGGRHYLSKTFMANEHPSVSSWVQVCSRCPYKFSYLD